MYNLLSNLAAQCLKKPARGMANFIWLSLFNHEVFTSLSFFSSSIEMENWGDALLPSIDLPPIITNFARFAVHRLNFRFFYFNRFTFAHKSIQFGNDHPPRTGHFPIPFQNLIRRIEYHHQTVS